MLVTTLTMQQLALVLVISAFVVGTGELVWVLIFFLLSFKVINEEELNNLKKPASTEEP